MLESGLSGSVRGVPSNGHPYRDPGPIGDAPASFEARELGVVFNSELSAGYAEVLQN